MTAPHIPDEVRRFLLGAIPSVPHLEALLLLHADPARGWDAVALAGRLYLDPPRAAALLADLVRAELAVADDGGYRFETADPALAAVVGELARVYARHVVAVAELIHSTPDRRARRFADAFLLRKDT
ncbi:MAG TPA: hypothetical protein VFG18_02475 [Xanthomonadaceae bacterium]|jgi:hypothetical protein|nr:hypothetical protein [Xanthomonadaceae bacterium]